MFEEGGDGRTYWLCVSVLCHCVVSVDPIPVACVPVYDVQSVSGVGPSVVCINVLWDVAIVWCLCQCVVRRSVWCMRLGVVCVCVCSVFGSVCVKRICQCHSCGIDFSCRWDSIFGLGNFYMPWIQP